MLGEREEFTRETVKFCKLLTVSDRMKMKKVGERKGFDFQKG